MKGAISDGLPMLGLFIVAVGLGGMSLAIPEGVAGAMSESGSDIANLAQGKSNIEHMINYSIPDAGKQANLNSAYELGRANAGVSWQTIPTVNDIHDEWTSLSTQELNDRKTNLFTTCIAQTDYRTIIFEETEESTAYNRSQEKTNITVEPQNEAEMAFFTCENNNNIHYREQNSGRKLSYVNRYPALVNYTVDFYNEAERQYNTNNVESRYEGSDTPSCPGDGSYADAEREAFSSFNSDAVNFQSVKNSNGEIENTTVTGSADDQYIIVDRSSESTDCCVGGGEDEECTPRSGSHKFVTIRPDYSDLTMEISTEEEYPINRQYRKLSIMVDEYSYEY